MVAHHPAKPAGVIASTPDIVGDQRRGSPYDLDLREIAADSLRATVDMPKALLDQLEISQLQDAAG